jgi:hypothetical protein
MFSLRTETTTGSRPFDCGIRDWNLEPGPLPGCSAAPQRSLVTYLGAGNTEECSLGLGHPAIYLVEMRATVGLKPRFETLRASFTMLILEKRGRLVMVFPLQSPRKAKATSISDSRFRAAA